MQDQEIENQFQELELERSVNQAVKEDDDDKNVRDPKLKALLGDKECLQLNCPLKSKTSQQADKIDKLKHKFAEVTKDNEDFRKALGNKATDVDRKECLTKAMKDEYVQVLREDTEGLRTTISDKDSAIMRLTKMVSSLKQARRDYESLLRTDQELSDKWKQYRLLEERCAQMDVWYREAHKKAGKLHGEFEKTKLELINLRREKEEIRNEYKEYQELISHADALLRKGCQVTPPRKRFWRNPFKKYG